MTPGLISFARVRFDEIWAGDKRLTREDRDLFDEIMKYAAQVFQASQGARKGNK